MNKVAFALTNPFGFRVVLVPRSFSGSLCIRVFVVFCPFLCSHRFRVFFIARPFSVTLRFRVFFVARPFSVSLGFRVCVVFCPLFCSLGFRVPFHSAPVQRLALIQGLRRTLSFVGMLLLRVRLVTFSGCHRTTFLQNLVFVFIVCISLSFSSLLLIVRHVSTIAKKLTQKK